MRIKLGCLWLPHIRVCPLYPKCLWVECFPSMTLVDEVSYHLLHKIENDFHHTKGFLLSTWRTWGAPCAIALLSSFSGKNNRDKSVLPFVEIVKSSRKILQSLSHISSKDFLLQWRSSKARCFSRSRCFFIRDLKWKIKVPIYHKCMCSTEEGKGMASW